MGWWWSNSSSQKEESGPTPLPASSQSSPQQPQPPPPQPRTLTLEEQAEVEFKQLLASLESDINRGNSSQQQQDDPSTKSVESPDLQSLPSSIAPDSLYTDTMSCRSAFDYAFFCQSLGGQFVNVYRYGELRSCSEHWDNFWLCMKTRTFPDKERKRVIREHYKKKAIKYKTGPSSEDVWDVRAEPIDNAFQGDFAALEREMKAEEETKAKQSAGSV